MTPGQRWRRKRDLVIRLAWLVGVPQPLLADVFGLSRSRVWAIVHPRPDDFDESPDCGRPEFDGSVALRGDWVASEVRKAKSKR